MTSLSSLLRVASSKEKGCPTLQATTMIKPSMLIHSY
uniref:Uncharacterized protein n=1 Tax=Arundo donax TaxID=35708 RepID=A0A0A9BYQ9_ARUDO